MVVRVLGINLPWVTSGDHDDDGYHDDDGEDDDDDDAHFRRKGSMMVSHCQRHAR